MSAHAPRQPGAHRVLNREQTRSEQNQIRDQILEQFFPGLQKKKPAKNAADDACRNNQPQSAFLAAQVVPLRERPAEVAGTQRHSVGHVGGHGRYAQKGERGKGDQRPAARQGVDRARGQRGERGEEEIEGGEHEESLRMGWGKYTGNW